MSGEPDQSFQDVRQALHKVLEEESHLLMTQLRGEIAAELRAIHSKELANFGLQLKHMMSEVQASSTSKTSKPRRSKGSSFSEGPNETEASATPGKAPDASKCSDLGTLTENDSQATASTASTAGKEVASRAQSPGEIVIPAGSLTCVPKPCTVGLVNHELRSPLNGLAGYARTLAETDAKYQKEFRLFTNTAQFALENVTNLIDLWTYAGKQIGELVSDGVSLEDLNDVTQEHLNRATSRKGKPLVKSAVNVEMTVDDPNCALSGDFTALAVLHFQLVANSVKFTERGKVTVAWCRSDEGLCLTVGDTGIGISADNLGRIFDPFEVEDKSESRKFEGIGLGLAVVREIARLHRAKIFVESTKGEGSSIRVVFPNDSIVDAASVRARPGRLKTRAGRVATSP